jgi:hypothetical protein
MGQQGGEPIGQRRRSRSGAEARLRSREVEGTVPGQGVEDRLTSAEEPIEVGGPDRPAGGVAPCKPDRPDDAPTDQAPLEERQHAGTRTMGTTPRSQCPGDGKWPLWDGTRGSDRSAPRTER